MFTFLAGCAAGAAVLRYYEKSDEACGEIDGDDDPLLTPGNRGMFSPAVATSSRATLIKQNNHGKIAYNEFADTTVASHINFLSDIAARMWPYFNQAGATMIREMIEPTFNETLPGVLSSLKFRKLDLGHVPFVLDNILVRELQKVEGYGTKEGECNEYLQFEWDLTWNSKCDIQLATEKIGGVAAISFGVKAVSLCGRLQVIAKPLTGVVPCMDCVQFAFVNPPTVELDFTGLANLADMNLRIGSYSVVDIKGAVRNIVNDILAQSLVLPNRTIAPLVDNVDFRDAFCPAYRGLARVQLHSGRGFEIQKASTRFGKDDIPDVYVKIRLGAEEFFESSVVKDNCSPVWDPDVDFHDFLFCGRDQILEIQAWDRDSGTLDKDDKLGTTFVTIGQVLLGMNGDGKFEFQLMKTAKRKGKNDTPTGQYLTISLEQIPFTTTNLSSIKDVFNDVDMDGSQSLTRSQRKKKKKKKGKRVVGLTTVLISHAKNLPFDSEEDGHTFVKLWSGRGSDRTEIGVTPIIPNTLNPAYQTPFSVPLRISDLTKMNDVDDLCYIMEVFNQRPSDSTPRSIGEISITYNDVKNSESEGWSLRDCRPLGERTKYKTELAFSVFFAGISPSPLRKRLSYDIEERTTSTTSRSDLTTSGMNERTSELEDRIRVRIVKGYGFETDQKARFRKADIPDVYCVIKFGSSPTPWRTATIKDSETPEWANETRDYIMQSANEVISIDVWDENRKSDDDYYGNARTSVGKVLLNGGSLDLEVKPEKEKKKSKMKKMMGNVGLSGGSGGVRVNSERMFITVECTRL